MKAGDKVYVSGPMSGMPDFNRPMFHEISAHLRSSGFDAVSPPELYAGTDWHEAMRADLLALPQCHHIVLLPGWKQSVGAGVELSIALMLEIQAHEAIRHFDGWQTYPFDKAKCDFYRAAIKGNFPWR